MALSGWRYCFELSLRDRDTMQQERVPIEKLSGLVEEKVGVRKVLERLG